MIAVIADNLTGASDAGEQYGKNGHSVLVCVSCRETLGKRKLGKADVLSFNTDSRKMERQDAYQKVYQLAAEIQACYEPEYFYKKIDSLLRGNPAIELDAVMDAAEAEIAIVAPSFPENNRQIEGGILTLPDGKKLNVTAVFDRETKRRVKNIPLIEIRQGEDALLELIEKERMEGTEVFVLDAVSGADLSIISRMVKGLSVRSVLCGSAGFAKRLSEHAAMPAVSGYEKKPEGITLIAAGSKSKTTARQIKKAASVAKLPIVFLDTDEVDGGWEENARAVCLEKIKEFYDQGERTMILAIGTLFEEFHMVTKGPAEYRKTPVIPQVIGSITEDIYQALPVGAIVANGGSTALQICNALQVKEIRLLDEITPGIPIGKAEGGVAEGVLLITKSDFFGTEDVFLQILEYLRKISL